MRMVVCCLIFVAALFGTAMAQPRVALVIGNADYVAVGRLANPLNDARGIAQVLQRALGFQVTAVSNGTRGGMVTALDRFAVHADRAEIALVFYAGHALEVDGINFLLPVDARIAHEREVETQAVSLNAVMARLTGAQVRIVLLDACRDNPFAAQMVRARATRGLSRGLAEVSNAPRGTLIAFATSPGEVAADGAGANSPFSAALMTHLATPDEDIRVVMGAVADSVQAATRHQPQPQVPWQNSSLGGTRVILRPSAAVPASPPPPAPAPRPVASAIVPGPSPAQPRQQALPARPPAAPSGPAPSGFPCPPAGGQIQYASAGGRFSVVHDGADPVDPEVCLIRREGGPQARLLFNFYPMPIASGEAVARRDFGSLLRGERNGASFVVGLPSVAGGTEFYDDTWRRLPAETVTVGGRQIPAAVFELDRNGRFGVAFRGRMRLWQDPASGVWLKRTVTMWAGEPLPSFDAVAVVPP